MTYLVDTHCHLDFQQYADDLTDVLARAADVGVRRIVAPGIDLASSREVVDLANRHDMVVAAVGVHPNSSAEWQDNWIAELRLLARCGKVVAIGEIGLDYYRDHSPRQVQQRAFEAQIALAVELDLPVIVHNRQADQDVLQRLPTVEEGSGTSKGVLHSFSGPWSTAAVALEKGYYLGFTGPITFKKATELRNVAVQVPMERLLVETDGPFLAPHPYRGKRNEPSYVRYVARKLAELKQINEAEIACRTSANAARLFGKMVAFST